MMKAILFDLDNTLYSEKCGVYDLIDQRMNEWLITRLNVSPEDVNEFRHRYFMQYGTTLRGLMVHHQVNPRDFLDFVHDVPVHEFLKADLELREVLEKIQVRKMVFTNSDLRHANRILDALGIRDLFEKIFDIEAMHYIPKPNPEPYRLALDYLGTEPADVMLIDDMERNLVPARKLGIRTLLIGDGQPTPDTPHIISNIKELSHALSKITEG